MTFKQLKEKLGRELVKSEWHKHENGGGWVENSATVEKTAYVGENAIVSDNAQVSGKACIYNNARVSGDARVSDNACVYGSAWVSDNACVYGSAWVSDNTRISGNARISDNTNNNLDLIIGKKAAEIALEHFKNLLDGKPDNKKPESKTLSEKIAEQIKDLLIKR